MAGSVTRGYDPVRSSVSDLAAGDASSRWLMTAALVLTGLGYLVTAVGLRPADAAGRTVLAIGGIAVLLMAWIPNATVGRNAVGHMIVTYLGVHHPDGLARRDRPEPAGRPAGAAFG